MSGTSLDGVDAALLGCRGNSCRVLEQAFLPFSKALRQELLALNAPGDDEVRRTQLAGNQLAELYAACVTDLRQQSGLAATAVQAIGCHGQTIRHRPDLGFTVQIGNAALLAELSGIRVITDFRSRDIAAGGQGAPLVPAFHQAVFGDPGTHRVIVNIGGISNLTDLPHGRVAGGFDCGPGNLLMDGWVQRHLGQAYDAEGAWAATGQIIPSLLQRWLAHPFFRLAPPKSTGRDDFHLDWLLHELGTGHNAADVQATLLELTARSISDAIVQYAPGAEEIYICGGGARNHALMARLAALLAPLKVAATDTLGIPANIVEAAAFAWLARQTLLGLPGNLPAATGAAGSRILGAIYPV